MASTVLPNTVSENRQWERCPTRQMIGLSKFTHGHNISREQPSTREDCRRQYTNNKTHPNGMPLTQQ